MEPPCCSMEHPPMVLLRGASCVYTGDHVLPRRAVLVSSSTIAHVLPDHQEADALATALGAQHLVRVLDVGGCIVLPGLIDVHVHVCGGGGEMGPASRTPESKLSELLEAGITTVVGVLGTDSVTRSLENLLAKCHALEHDGISAFMYVGAYAVPPPTLTGRIMKDVSLIDKVVGVGEIAISDHRSSCPTLDELSRIVSEVRVGGMLSGTKRGVAYFHVGSGAAKLDPLFDVVDKAEMPVDQMLPTHVNRNVALLAAAVQWVARGGTVDVTASFEGAADSIRYLVSQGVPLESRLIVSSDAYGSCPVFDEAGNLLSYGVSKPSSLLACLRDLVLNSGSPGPAMSLQQVVPALTSTVAKFYGFSGKGRIQVGMDADLIALDPETLELRYVIAKGRVVKTPEWVQRGMFE